MLPSPVTPSSAAWWSRSGPLAVESIRRLCGGSGVRRGLATTPESRGLSESTRSDRRHHPGPGSRSPFHPSERVSPACVPVTET